MLYILIYIISLIGGNLILNPGLLVSLKGSITRRQFFVLSTVIIFTYCVLPITRRVIASNCTRFGSNDNVFREPFGGAFWLASKYLLEHYNCSISFTKFLRKNILDS